MKKLFFLAGFLMMGQMFGQTTNQPKEISANNSWLKLGLTAAVPVGDASDYSNFNLGLDARAQYLVNPNIGIGIASGYSHYFAKDNYDDFGIIPLAAFGRYYFEESGPFVGVDLGYGFLTNVENSKGGLYVSPQVGYNTYNWNFYAFYKHTSGGNDFNIQSVGVGATYNIRFNN